jgi:hypothetical protein
MILDIQKTYNTIENDLLDNQKDVLNMYNYYTHKYRGNRLNDINVGLFLNDRQEPVAQVFVRNQSGYIKSHLVFNREGTEIVEVRILNKKIDE